MKRLITRLTWLLALLSFWLSACTKNEFTVNVFPDSERPVSAELVYYASDARQGWVVTQDLPVGMGSEKLSLMTRNPTVVFVSSGGRTVSCFYAERGDKLTLRSRRGFWTAEGNDVSDRLAAWMRENQQLIEADAGSALNAAVAKYVRAHPADIASAIMLYAFYNPQADPDGFSSLIKTLREKAAGDDLRRALGRIAEPQAPNAMPALRLRALGDTVLEVNPRQARATIYLFWSDPGRHARAALDLRHKLKGNDGVKVADINMQADTLNWRQTMRQDSTLSWTCLWAPGAEQNASLSQLGLPGADCLIVADGRARILYRGNDPATAADKALSLK